MQMGTGGREQEAVQRSSRALVGCPSTRSAAATPYSKRPSPRSLTADGRTSATCPKRHLTSPLSSRRGLRATGPQLWPSPPELRRKMSS